MESLRIELQNKKSEIFKIFQKPIKNKFWACYKPQDKPLLTVLQI